MPEDGAHAIFLIEEIRAEAGHIGYFVAEIDVAGFLEKLDFILWSDLIKHGLEVVVLQRWEVNPLQLAPDAQNGRVAGRKVQVRGALLEH